MNVTIKLAAGVSFWNCSQAGISPTPINGSIGSSNDTSGEIWTADVIQRVVTIVVIMVLTLIGNVAIILVLTCSNYRIRNNRVNIFIINLAVGDLAVCFITMTTEILFVAFGEWVLGGAGCKLLTYIQVVTLSSTTFILAAMAFDRYLAICKPLKFTTTNSRARRMIVISWIISFVVSVPQLFIFVQTADGVHSDNTPRYVCVSQGYTAQWQRKVYVTFMLFYILVLPSLVLSYCYINVARVVWKQGRADTGLNNADASLRRFIVNKGVISLAKMRTVKMTFCIILTFIACWTPYFVITLCVIYSNNTLKIPGFVITVAETMNLLQSAVNPVLYGIFNIKFCTALMEIFCPKRLKTKRFNSFAPCHGVNGFLISATSDRRHVNTLATSKHLVPLCVPEKAPKNVASTSDASMEHTASSSGRAHGSCIVAESNVHGYKLRVRFITKETVQVLDKHGRCLYNSAHVTENESTV